MPGPEGGAQATTLRSSDSVHDAAMTGSSSERAWFSPARCHIDLAAIAGNFARLGPAHRLMPVIKSDAYGHGLVRVARTLSAVGAASFAVGQAQEGLALRRVGLGQQIVTLLPTLDAESLDACRSQDIVLAVGDAAQLERCAAHGDVSHPLAIALQCETGMGRLGFGPQDVPQLVERLRSLPGLKPVLALSHLACADMPEEDDFSAAQARTFAAMCQGLRSAFPGMKRSLANSAGLIQGLGQECEWHRPGLSLYGGNPLAAAEGKPGKKRQVDGLRWAMSVCAPIVAVRRLEAGQSVSYGRTYTARGEMTLAVVGVGYASGLARGLSNRSQMLVNGRRAPQVGRVCMGLTMLDVSDVGPVVAGDTAWILGGPVGAADKPVTAQELADILGTIPYEILCLFGGMVERTWQS